MAKKVSLTAQFAALARAAGTREPETIRLEDTMAERFLDRRFKFLLNQPLRWVATRTYDRLMPGAYAYVLARVRRFDEVVRQELAAGAEQLVVLGAGFDSRAYRFRELLGNGHAFEVDAPATSAQKQAKLREVLGELPAHVSYVPVDFDKESMDGPLRRAGFDPNKRTVFTWEGVTFYIGAEAVDQVLGMVGGVAKGSSIVFDYLFRAIVEGKCDEYGAHASRAYVARKGEPFTFGLEPDGVGEFLSARGLGIESNLRPSELAERYLGGHGEGRPPYRIGGFYGIASARVG